MHAFEIRRIDQLLKNDITDSINAALTRSFYLNDFFYGIIYLILMLKVDIKWEDH